MMSRRRKGVFFAVMLCGAAALVVDRCALSQERAVARGEPRASARAGRRSRPTPAAQESPSPTLQAEDGSSIPELPFPRGLPAFGPSAAVRDLFAPPLPTSARDSRGLATDKRSAWSTGQQNAGRVSSATFMTRHHLNGVLLHQRLRIAIVDGMWLRIGQSVDGCTLLGIGGNRARFECFDGQAELKVTNTKTFAGD